MREPHRLTSNSEATSVRRLRLLESAVASRLLFLRKIDRPATSDFCNKICQQEKSRGIGADLLQDAPTRSGRGQQDDLSCRCPSRLLSVARQLSAIGYFAKS